MLCVIGTDFLLLLYQHENSLLHSLSTEQWNKYLRSDGSDHLDLVSKPGEIVVCELFNLPHVTSSVRLFCVCFPINCVLCLYRDTSCIAPWMSASTSGLFRFCIFRRNLFPGEPDGFFLLLPLCFFSWRLILFFSAVKIQSV